MSAKIECIIHFRYLKHLYHIFIHTSSENILEIEIKLTISEIIFWRILLKVNQRIRRLKGWKERQTILRDRKAQYWKDWSLQFPQIQLESYQNCNRSSHGTWIYIFKAYTKKARTHTTVWWSRHLEERGKVGDGEHL